MNLEGVALAGTAERPWFDRRPRHATAVIVLLFTAVFLLRLTVGDERDGLSMLYVLPISLAAIGFGRRAGLLAGCVAIGLLAVWLVRTDVSLTPLGWLSRVLPLVLIGALIGGAADRIRAADAAERRADAVALLQLEAAEVNDSIVQHLSAAKWALEAGDTERALVIVDDTIIAGQRLVPRVLTSDSLAHDQLRRTRPWSVPPRQSSVGPS